MINRAALLELLTRYETHNCTPEEKQLVEQWYALLGEPVEIPLSEEQWIKMEQKLWYQMKPQIVESDSGNKKPKILIRKNIILIASRIAAMIAIVIGISWYQQVMQNVGSHQSLISNQEQADWIRYQNETNANKEIVLTDESVIVLAPNAQLAVHKAFNQKNRNVRLLGEASFNVHRDPSQPFLVYSGDIITQVLGTTFHIKANDPGQPIQVTVQSGKVTVYRQEVKEITEIKPSSGVILTPNQIATYFPDNKQFVTGITEDPKPILTTAAKQITDELIFNEVSIGEVIHQLEVIYGTEIELEQESLSQCPFTGNLTNKTLYAKLELLCGTINGNYEVRGTKILIIGNGCQ